METNDDIRNLINRIEVKTFKNVLDYIDCGIVDNNCNTNYRVYKNMIHMFLLNSEEIKPEFLFKLLKQSNLITIKLFSHENAELKEEYNKMRHSILQWLEK